MYSKSERDSDTDMCQIIYNSNVSAINQPLVEG